MATVYKDMSLKQPTATWYLPDYDGLQIPSSQTIGHAGRADGSQRRISKQWPHALSCSVVVDNSNIYLFL